LGIGRGSVYRALEAAGLTGEATNNRTDYRTFDELKATGSDV
jgi:hypothetical protein